jgi:hypothetical protein
MASINAFFKRYPATILAIVLLGIISTFAIVAKPFSPPTTPQNHPHPTAKAGRLHGRLIVHCAENSACDQAKIRSAFDVAVFPVGQDDPIALTPANDDGTFILTLPVGDYTVQTIPKADQAADTVTVKPDQTATADLTITAP